MDSNLESDFLMSTQPKPLSLIQPNGTGSANSSSRQIRENSAIEPILEEELIDERSADGTTEIKKKEASVSE